MNNEKQIQKNIPYADMCQLKKSTQFLKRLKNELNALLQILFIATYQYFRELLIDVEQNHKLLRYS